MASCLLKTTTTSNTLFEHYPPRTVRGLRPGFMLFCPLSPIPCLYHLFPVTYSVTYSLSF
jgi:hypothetical protein